MKKDSFYFPHDYNSRNDVKCLFLRQQLGMEGYGIFWFLVESLAESGGILPLKIVPVLAMQMQVPDVKVNAVINSFELFIIHNESFFSIRLNEHLNLRKILSEKGKLGVKIREASREALREASSKERKGKEILIVNNLIKKRENTILARKENFYNSVAEFKENYPKEMLRSFYNYWSELNKTGKRMRWELQTTFEVVKRLSTWANKEKTFFNNKKEKENISAQPLKTLN